MTSIALRAPTRIGDIVEDETFNQWVSWDGANWHRLRVNHDNPRADIAQGGSSRVVGGTHSIKTLVFGDALGVPQVDDLIFAGGPTTTTALADNTLNETFTLTGTGDYRTGTGTRPTALSTVIRRADNAVINSYHVSNDGDNTNAWVDGVGQDIVDSVNGQLPWWLQSRFRGSGYSAAIDGNTAILGGSFLNDTATIYTRTGRTWQVQTVLRGSRSDDFGESVAINGDTAVVGTDRGNFLSIYSRSGTTWSRVARFSNVGSQGVAVDGDTVAAVGGGNLRVFVRRGTDWSLQQTLGNGSEAVDISGATIIAGSVVYVRTNNTWSIQAGLGGVANDVAIDGDTACIAQLDTNTPGSPAGRIFVHTRSGSTWTQQASLAAGDRFGFSVDIDGDTIVASAERQDRAENAQGFDNAGNVYVFRRNGTTWTQESRLEPSTFDIAARFGFDVAVSEDAVFVTAVNEPATYAYFRDTDVISDWSYNAGSNIVDTRGGTADDFGLVVTTTDNGGTNSAISVRENSGFGNFPADTLDFTYTLGTDISNISVTLPSNREVADILEGLVLDINDPFFMDMVEGTDSVRLTAARGNEAATISNIVLTSDPFNTTPVTVTQARVTDPAPAFLTIDGVAVPIAQGDTGQTIAFNSSRTPVLDFNGSANGNVTTFTSENVGPNREPIVIGGGISFTDTYVDGSLSAVDGSLSDAHNAELIALGNVPNISYVPPDPLPPRVSAILEYTEAAVNAYRIITMDGRSIYTLTPPT